MKYYDVNLRDDRTIPNIVKVVRNVVNHRHPKLPELLAGGHPQGLPLGQTWKVFTNSEEISFGTLVWDFAFSNSGWSPLDCRECNSCQRKSIDIGGTGSKGALTMEKLYGNGWTWI